MILKEQLTPARMIQSMVDPLATEADSLRRNAAAYPDHIATIYRERRTSYADFNCRASQVANGLLRLDSCRQERVRSKFRCGCRCRSFHCHLMRV